MANAPASQAQDVTFAAATASVSSEEKADELAAISINSQPELRHLMNEVAAKIPAKWEATGTQLGLQNNHLEAIKMNRMHQGPDRCWSDVFCKWRSACTSEYTWRQLIKALKTNGVGEIELAKDLEQRLLSLD